MCEQPLHVRYGSDHFVIVIATYVKIYLVEGERICEKQRTDVVRNTLDPFYRQQLHFVQTCGGGRLLQVKLHLLFARSVSRDDVQAWWSRDKLDGSK